MAFCLSLWALHALWPALILASGFQQSTTTLYIMDRSTALYSWTADSLNDKHNEARGSKSLYITDADFSYRSEWTPCFLTWGRRWPRAASRRSSWPEPSWCCRFGRRWPDGLARGGSGRLKNERKGLKNMIPSHDSPSDWADGKRYFCLWFLKLFLIPDLVLAISNILIERRKIFF